MGRGEHPRQDHHKVINTNRHIVGKQIIIVRANKKVKAYVQLVLLGFDVTTFTPVAYQRGRLPRHLKVNSSCGRFRA